MLAAMREMSVAEQRYQAVLDVIGQGASGGESADLRFVPLDLALTQLAFGLDARICVSKQYRATQGWASPFMSDIRRPMASGTLRGSPAHISTSVSLSIAALTSLA
jgi:hypothetical protein